MKPKKRWVVLVYPVVTSLGGDNSGGYAHLVGNIQVYRHLGFRVICICRLHRRLLDELDGAICLNIVPGTAAPVQTSDSKSPQISKGTTWQGLFMRSLRQCVLEAALNCIKLVLHPVLLHQRANARFMVPRWDAVGHLIELNDFYVPDINCDGYLCVIQHSGLVAPQFVSPWPVPQLRVFDRAAFYRHLVDIRKREFVRVLLFGTGGVGGLERAIVYLAGHPWFAGKKVSLHVYGEPRENWDEAEGVVHHGWAEESAINPVDFDAGLLYYAENIYPDDRLRLGAPTKLAKYIDWSLPPLTNRMVVSDMFLGRYDQDRSVLIDEQRTNEYAETLLEARRKTTVQHYSLKFRDFVQDLGMSF